MHGDSRSEVRPGIAPPPSVPSRVAWANVSGAVEVRSEQLFEEATQGDVDALDRLLQRYLPQLHAFVGARMGSALRARESSVDVMQSVCRELLEERGRFDFQGEERFRAWLFTSALNKMRERHRRMHSGRRDVAREEAEGSRQAADLMAHFLTPSRVAIGNETSAAMAAALEALSEEHREVVTLARIVGLPHRVIAELMSRNEEATRQLLARAMVRLARELRRRGIDVEEWGSR